MAVGTFTFHDNGVEDAVTGSANWATDDHYAILVGGYTQSDTDDTYSDVSGDELADADYDAQDLSGEAETRSGDTITIKANPVEFDDPVSIGPASHIIILMGTAAAKSGGDKIVGSMDLDGAESVAGEFTVNWNGASNDEIADITKSP